MIVIVFILRVHVLLAEIAQLIVEAFAIELDQFGKQTCLHLIAELQRVPKEKCAFLTRMRVQV